MYTFSDYDPQTSINWHSNPLVRHYPICPSGVSITPIGGLHSTLPSMLQTILCNLTLYCGFSNIFLFVSFFIGTNIRQWWYLFANIEVRSISSVSKIHNYVRVCLNYFKFLLCIRTKRGVKFRYLTRSVSNLIRTLTLG